MGGFASKLGDFFSFLSAGDWDSADAAAEQSHAANANAAAEKKSGSGGILEDAAKKAGARGAASMALASVQKAASAVLASIQRAAETAVSYVSGLLAAASAAASSALVPAYGALKLAAYAAGNKVVELVKQLLGSGAAAAVKSRFDAVAAALRGGASSFAATVAAALDAAVSAGAREAFAALPELASAWVTNPAAAAASVVADIKFIVRFIPLVEKLLGLVIPAEVKAAIAVVAVAAGLYSAFCAAPAAGAPAGPIVTKAPGGGGASQRILRSAFEARRTRRFISACSRLKHLASVSARDALRPLQRDCHLNMTLLLVNP
ncbi:ice-structuring glycoprotein-like [Panicum hallii]|jgi:hypothetical protein|uniref:ice-structuring glycoprotein-like n=1 Tax=Panicum hallii TaxID=206008 RepID=UPI000DF4DC80|nr:ice-structuring glycoprotein-like [Panicum hallii]